MPTQMELLNAAQNISRNVDPDGDHQALDSGSFLNLNKSQATYERSLIAQTSMIGDDQSNGENAVPEVSDDPDQFEELNENNRRVAMRLRDEKARVNEVMDADKSAQTFGRAGSPANPGDLASGGKGGDFGEAGTAGRDLGEDARQHAEAWARQGVTKAAADAVVKDVAAGKPAALAKGKAAAASSSLLGDDSKPAASAWANTDGATDGAAPAAK